VRARRIEITIESHEIVVLGQRDNLRCVWCASCGERVAAVSLNDARKSSTTIETIKGQLEIGRLHLIETAGGPSLICLGSLTQNLKGDL